ncbi:MAG: hypothetical protein WC390_09000 [Sulfurimonas sp.]|jgi:uncharacterized membrane protein
MSNNKSTNPIQCDTAGQLVSSNGSIKSVVFVNDGADGDLTLVLVDEQPEAIGTPAGTKIIVKLELTAEHHTAIYVPPTPIPFHIGLYCLTIDGGLALIQV